MIEYKVIEIKDLPQVSEFLLQNFFQTEPFGLAFGMKTTQVERWLLTYLQDLFLYSTDNVSVMALNSNDIIGANISFVMDSTNEKPPPAMFEYLNSETEPAQIRITKFLDELESGLDLKSFLDIDAQSVKSLVTVFINVDEKFYRKGIGAQLALESERIAEINGVRMAEVITTSQYSYSIYTKLSYEVIREVIYLDYVDKNQNKPFKGKENILGTHKAARVMAKRYF